MAMVPPGRTDLTEWLAHRFDDRINLAWQSCGGFEGRVGTEFHGLGALGFAAGGDEHLQTGRMRELYGRGGHAAARTLNQNRIPGFYVHRGEQ